MNRKDLKYYSFLECPECGKRAIVTWVPASYVIKCDACGYSVATSLFHPIDLDDKKYTVKLMKKVNVTKEDLSIVSKMTGLNFIQCKKMFDNGGIVLNGSASELNEKIDLLIDNNIKLDIEPEWRYFTDPILKSKKWKPLD